MSLIQFEQVKRHLYIDGTRIIPHTYSTSASSIPRINETNEAVDYIGEFWWHKAEPTITVFREYGNALCIPTINRHLH